MSIKASSGGDVKAIESRLGPKGRRVFSVAGWNDSLRKAGIAAGDWWIGNYGVLRFKAGYAMNVLGYTPGPRKMTRLRRGEAPFVSSGQFMAGFNTRSRTSATATKGHVRFSVLIPGGYLNYHPKHVAVFRNVPPRESAAVAREFRRALIQILQTGRVAHAAKKKAQADARAAKKHATAARRKEARANKSTRRQKATRKST